MDRLREYSDLGMQDRNNLSPNQQHILNQFFYVKRTIPILQYQMLLPMCDNMSLSKKNKM